LTKENTTESMNLY